MRTVHNFQLEEETLEEQFAAQRYNPATVLIRNRQRMFLACGNSDTVRVFKDGKETFVLSYNRGLSYAGLQIFDTYTGEETGSVFQQNAEVDLDLSDITICKILALAI
jgi:hypothetical protein